MLKKILILLFAFALLLSGCESAENSVPPEENSKSAASALRELGVEKGTVSLRCLPRQYPSQMFEL